MRAREWVGRGLLLAFGVLVATVTVEVALRVSGFGFSLNPTVQFGWPDPVTLQRSYRPDGELLWVPDGYEARLEEARAWPPLVIFMGDSCTEFGRYPEWTMDLLAEGGTDPVTGLNLGVGGWSSEQGRRQLQRDVLALRPRVVTLYFGWNDHWVALGPADSDLPLSRTVAWLEARSRLAQMALKARVGASAPRPERPNRVPLERYVENLRLMVREANAAGIAPVLITAPSGHVMGEEPQYLLERHLRTLGELVPMHEAYEEATRMVAREEGAELCDAADWFRRDPDRNGYFLSDGIHLSDSGDRRLAEIVSACIRRALASSTPRSRMPMVWQPSISGPESPPPGPARGE